MKQKIFAFILALTLIVSSLPFTVFAAGYTPPDSYGAPKNVGVIFNGDELDVDESGRWSFDIGFGASDETRLLAQAEEDGRFEEAGFNSLGISIQGDYKLDNGKWRSELPGYEDWVSTAYAGFDAETGYWVGSWHADEYNFEEIIPDGILPGGKSYFDSHTMHFRVRFYVGFYNSETGTEYEYYSPWSESVSYTSNQKLEDPAALINHAPKLLTVELKQKDDGQPYLDFTADKAHDDIQKLNNNSNQRVFTNVWMKVNGGEWRDAGEFMWMKEQFTVDADDYFGNIENYDAATYEVKFRYTLNCSYYPASGKSETVYSPFSNVISHGMPAYEGASAWAKTELDKAAGYGFITDKIKGNMSGKITREEFAEIAVKLYEKYTGKTAVTGNTSFADTTNPEILKAANLGLVAGVGNNKYAPNDLVTREQMATILLRALKVINPTADFSNEGAAKFADDDKVESWARDGVYYCAKAKIVTGVGDNMFDPDGNATREAAVIVCTRAYEYYKS
ncbi:S-layer homology domain-containing protein [Petroclostridium sp. X23]|uniref:S-layer homology domain-containing protein n=1 Tax=Petroclostridium sp. X23 TaxID=3045146 RepID=UPI0024AE8086|nr:S-layer homology domain-containing protein [Petroclostridium sp. X23]WHH61067.1 S-layer homology domain-containing protein [Petroclostridium sp. X23]